MGNRVVLGSTAGDATIVVTVVNSGGNKYAFGGNITPDINITVGGTYTFDQSHSSNSNHPFRFSTTLNGSHAGGSAYTTGVTVVGTPGNAGAYTRIVVSASTAALLYYYCTNHSGMGASAKVSKLAETQGLFISKEGQDVLICAKKELTFDSTAHRTGLVYAGATGLNLGDSADNFLTTGSKASLGYPPLVVVSEKNTGERYSNTFDNYTDQISHWKTTTSTLQPATGRTATNNSGVLSGSVPTDFRGISGVLTSQENAFNVSYFVLRIPCAYGYMNSTYFG